jgi:hypothetical protein
MQAQGGVMLGKEGCAASIRGQERPRHTIHSTHNHAENDVPQPHDFVAWGFTNTNPCCIKVS